MKGVEFEGNDEDAGEIKRSLGSMGGQKHLGGSIHVHPSSPCYENWSFIITVFFAGNVIDHAFVGNARRLCSKDGGVISTCAIDAHSHDNIIVRQKRSTNGIHGNLWRSEMNTPRDSFQNGSDTIALSAWIKQSTDTHCTQLQFPLIDIRSRWD